MDSNGPNRPPLDADPILKVYGPSVDHKAIDEDGRKEEESEIKAVSAELGGGIAKASVGIGIKAGTQDNADGFGFTAETKFAEASFGPASAKLGLGVSTGIQAGNGNYGAKLLGTGLRVGEDGVAVSVLGSEASCCIM